jgi:hypothetical protein
VDIFSYVVRYDFGFAPNPFHGTCTLATCKQQIRRTARVGDWVMGTGSQQKSLAGRLVYVMQVEEVLTFDDYWADARFTAKIPRTSGALKHAYGDNIYHREGDEWIQADSRHSLPDGTINPGHVAVDTSADAVLLSSTYSYFGGSGPKVPDQLRTGFPVDLVHQSQGHRRHFPPGLVTAADQWFRSLESGLMGRPADWSTRPITRLP